MTSRETDAMWKMVPAGYALAMAVLQSDLYQRLDDEARAQCDAMLTAAPQPPAQPEYEMRESTREEMLRDWQQLGSKLFGEQPAGERAELTPEYLADLTPLGAVVMEGPGGVRTVCMTYAQLKQFAAALLEADAQRPAQDWAGLDPLEISSGVIEQGCGLCGGQFPDVAFMKGARWAEDKLREKNAAQRPNPTSDQSVTSDYMAWAKGRDFVGGNEAWNAGVAWADAQRPAMWVGDVAAAIRLTLDCEDLAQRGPLEKALALIEAAALLEADAQRPAMKPLTWTPVTEQMPPPDSWLLVVWGDHKAVDKAHTFSKWKHPTHPLGYLIQGHPGAHTDVTHWMLLPSAHNIKERS